MYRLTDLIQGFRCSPIDPVINSTVDFATAMRLHLFLSMVLYFFLLLSR